MIYPLLHENPLANYMGVPRSVISNEKTNTWGAVGIVVNMPRENAITAYKEDQRSTQGLAGYSATKGCFGRLG